MANQPSISLTRALSVCSIGCVLVICLALSIVCHAQSVPNDWAATAILPTPSGVTSMQWSKFDYSPSNVYSDEATQFWYMSSSNLVTSKTGVIHSPGAETAGAAGFMPDGSLRIAWLTQGMTSAGGVYSGDAIRIWSYTSAGVQTVAGPAYSPGTGWHSVGVNVLPDGTLRATWLLPGTANSIGVYGGDTLQVWSIGSDGQATSRGPNLFEGAGWRYGGVCAATDETMRLLWTAPSVAAGTEGRASVWSIDSTGQETDKGPILFNAPYSNAGAGLGIAGDNTLRLAWLTSVPGSAQKLSIWSLDTQGKETVKGPAYAPPPGYDPGPMSVASDGATWIKWLSVASPQAITLWSFDATGSVTSEGPVYSIGGKWTSFGPILSTDSSVQLFWNLPPPAHSKTGEGKVWTFSTAGAIQVKGLEYHY